MTSSLLRRHAEESKIVLGVNHPMVDYATGRPKKLDLVITRPGGETKKQTLGSLLKKHKIILTAEQQSAFDALPVIREAAVGSVQIALEAKAVMTAHIKSLPRFYDELNSSHLCVYSASSQAVCSRHRPSGPAVRRHFSLLPA